MKCLSHFILKDDEAGMLSTPEEGRVTASPFLLQPSPNPAFSTSPSFPATPCHSPLPYLSSLPLSHSLHPSLPSSLPPTPSSSTHYSLPSHSILPPIPFPLPPPYLYPPSPPPPTFSLSSMSCPPPSPSVYWSVISKEVLE